MTATISGSGGASRSAIAIAIAIAIVIAFLAAISTSPQSGAAAIQAPDVTARGVYAYDAETGIELFARNEHERVSIGSTVKIVTALVTVKYANLEDKVTIVESDLVDTAIYSNMQL